MRHAFRSIKTVSLLAILGLAISVAGCGGGGSTTGGTTPPATTTITGTVGKGIFTSGVVECYFVNGATKGPLFTSATINSNGGYTLDIGTNSGIVLLEAYGSYIDESTNAVRTITKNVNPPQRSVIYIAGPSGAKVAAITPLTELAVRNAYSRSTALTQENVEAANALVSDIYTFDIQTTLPVQPSATALVSASPAQKRYTMILAGISNLAPTPSQIHSLLTTYSSDLSAPPNRISGANITALNNSITSFLDTNSNNNTGYTSTMAQQIPLFSQVGFYSTIVTITATQNSPTADSIANIIQFGLQLDNNLTVENSGGTLSDNVITILADTGNTQWDAQLVDDTATGKKVLNVNIINTLTGLRPNENLATIRIRTNPNFNPSPTSIVVKHVYQNNVENTLIPFAAKDVQSTTTVDWSINAAF